MEFITTTRGGRKLIYNSFMYAKLSQSKNKICWLCVKCNEGCRGNLLTDLDLVGDPTSGQQHNHPANVVEIAVTKVRACMKRKATTTREKSSQIFIEAVATCDENIRAMLPNEDVCKRTIRSQRPHYDEVKQLRDLGDIPVELQVTSTNEPFVMYDNRNVENRILAFASETCLRKLAASRVAFMDGNFAMAPTMFSQVSWLYSSKLYALKFIYLCLL